MNLTIEGIPVAWAAHQGYGSTSYNPRAKEREQYRWHIKSAYKGHYCQKLPLACPVIVYVVYNLPIPKAMSKVRRDEMLKDIIKHTKRPDLDNLNKFLLDCLKTIVFEDDSQVVSLFSQKMYGEKPKTIITVEKI